MTASLAAGRRRRLAEECGLQVFPDTLEGLEELRTRAEHVRYSLRRVSFADAQQRAEQALKAQKKVLWVVNQVSRCQDIAAHMCGRVGAATVLCYHSRFKLTDRRARHKAVVDAFQTQSDPLLAVTTQVCEMSLDLDADVLITEEAPIPSLIQRMGRCNRKGVPDDERLGEVYVYPVEDAKPYRLEELAVAQDFIAALEEKRLSQADLEAAMEHHQPVQRDPDRFSSFLESGCYAMSQAYRDSVDFTTPAVLDTELGVWQTTKKGGKPTDGFVVPVPKRFARPSAVLGSLLSVVPASHYHPSFGFLDHPAF